MRTSAGDSDSFGKTPDLPAQVIKEYDHAVKQGLNLAGVAGSLNWLALRSRPDIAWALSRASRMVPKRPSIQSSERKRQTQGLGLCGCKLRSNWSPTGDASHEGMCLIHGGTSEDIFRGNLIHWKSNKQSLVTKSSCEAELLALVSVAETSEILGLYNAEGMRNCNSYESSSDNTACLSLLNSTHPSFRSRHISVRGEWLRQWRQRGTRLSYVSTDRQIADSLTKGLTLSPNTLHQLRLV
eukprot:4914842-Amphidinium_carterae.1